MESRARLRQHDFFVCRVSRCSRAKFFAALLPPEAPAFTSCSLCVSLYRDRRATSTRTPTVLPHRSAPSSVCFQSKGQSTALRPRPRRSAIRVGRKSTPAILILTIVSRPSHYACFLITFALSFVSTLLNACAFFAALVPEVLKASDKLRAERLADEGEGTSGR